MNIKFIIAVVVLTIIALIFSSSLGDKEEATTQPTKSTTTVATTQKATTTTTSTTKPTEQDISQEDVSAAVTSPAEIFDVLAPNAGLYAAQKKGNCIIIIIKLMLLRCNKYITIYATAISKLTYRARKAVFNCV